ncbi:hypothetical protein G6L14_10630 [Agrobacterium vitis]|uniref:hypothetical protein n=1 Tax=Agrobacterium vitis TaxID=373 RepID=UPI00157363ED|nr:hypothetical protein [Agrobacterium vitis]NSY12469.1 hypothetical protein [Agrobacterium vitis]
MQKRDSTAMCAGERKNLGRRKMPPLTCLLADIEGQITSIQRIVAGINDLLVIEDPETTYRRNKTALELSWYLETLTDAVSQSVLAAIDAQDVACDVTERVAA